MSHGGKHVPPPPLSFAGAGYLSTGSTITITLPGVNAS